MRTNQLYLISFLYLLLFADHAFCQEVDLLDLMEYDTVQIDNWDSLLEYKTIENFDRFNPHIGGSEKRYCNGEFLCSGLVIDYYPDSTIKHKGYYSNGVISTTYSNYFPDSSLERSFKLSGSRGALLDVYYPNDTLRSSITYFKGEPIKWADYYPNGNPEFYEEYRKNFETLISRKFYYTSGQLMYELILISKKDGEYHNKTFYPNGETLEEGSLISLSSAGDMRRTGMWKKFDNNGNLISSVVYINGKPQIE